MGATLKTTFGGAFGAAFGLVAMAVAPAWAADTPSASQIINQLSPTGGGAMTTRGIRLGGQPPATEKPGTPASTGPAMRPSAGTGGMARPPTADRPLEANLTVQFASGSSTVLPAGARVLDQLGQALASPNLAGFKFRVEGHTDTVGAPEMNKALSEQRAAAVTEYLVSKFNIDRARLNPVGMGQDGLLIATGPGVSSAANRRVLVVNLGK